VSTSFERHIPDAMLDEFVMEMLSESDCAVWEEHLLMCAHCQDRVAKADEYVRAMKSAAAEVSGLGAGEDRGSLPTADHAGDVPTFLTCAQDHYSPSIRESEALRSLTVAVR
jgi:hypothetical protein